MSTGDSHSPGNYGLKDQLEAMKWVRDHIHGFGGDPLKVTLFGHEAGGASVHFHMMSRKSPQYFSGGISSSGTAFNYWALHTKEEAVKVTKELAKSLHCPDFDPSKIVACLKSQKAVTLVNKQMEFLVRLKNHRLHFSVLL